MKGQARGRIFRFARKKENNMNVSEIMTKDVTVVRPDMDIRSWQNCW